MATGCCLRAGDMCGGSFRVLGVGYFSSSHEPPKRLRRSEERKIDRHLKLSTAREATARRGGAAGG